MDLLAEITPQVVGQAGVTGMAIAKALTTGRINRLVDRIDHLSHLDAMHVTGQLVAATRSTDAGNQIAAAQLGKQLFKVGQGDPLPFGDIGQGHGPVLRVQRQVKHGSYGVSAFCSQSHGVYHGGSEWSEYAIPEYLSQL